jgi:hypothetical protein
VTDTEFTPTAEHMEAVHYGIPVASVGEDGDMLALGHHDPRRALAAFNAHARRLGLCNVADDHAMTAAEVLDDITQQWGYFRLPDPEQDDDPDALWYVDRFKSAADPYGGGTPFTYLSLG